jgi:hypothetical protein
MREVSGTHNTVHTSPAGDGDEDSSEMFALVTDLQRERSSGERGTHHSRRCSRSGLWLVDLGNPMIGCPCPCP